MSKHTHGLQDFASHREDRAGEQEQEKGWCSTIRTIRSRTLVIATAPSSYLMLNKCSELSWSNCPGGLVAGDPCSASLLHHIRHPAQRDALTQSTCLAILCTGSRSECCVKHHTTAILRCAFNLPAWFLFFPTTAISIKAPNALEALRCSLPTLGQGAIHAIARRHEHTLSRR